jgi:hypothetical protein
MSRFSKNDMRKTLTLLTSQTTTARGLKAEELERRVEMFTLFAKNLVEFRQGRQSSCRGAWTSKEYSEIRLMLRQVPKEQAFEM